MVSSSPVSGWYLMASLEEDKDCNIYNFMTDFFLYLPGPHAQTHDKCSLHLAQVNLWMENGGKKVVMNPTIGEVERPVSSMMSVLTILFSPVRISTWAQIRRMLISVQHPTSTSVMDAPQTW